MNQGASQILVAVLLGAALLGLLVLLGVPDYREGMILSSNREYMPAVQVENTDVELPAPQESPSPRPLSPREMEEALPPLASPAGSPSPAEGRGREGQSPAAEAAP